MTPTFDRRRAVVRPAAPATTSARPAVVALVALAVALVAGPAAVVAMVVARSAPAAAVAAHARVTGSVPADGSVVDTLPDRVTVTFSGKPATPEGDPLLVYDPAGRRIDDGDVRVEAGGAAMSVGISRGAGAPGDYVLVFRVVSADSHVIAGRLGFAVSGGAGSTTGWMGLVQPDRPHVLRATGHADPRPEVLVSLTAAMALLMLRRTVRPRPGRPLPPPAAAPVPVWPAGRRRGERGRVLRG